MSSAPSAEEETGENMTESVATETPTGSVIGPAVSKSPVEEEYDLQCENCENEGRNTTATVFSRQAQKYLCQKCHELETGDKPAIAPEAPGEKCPIHRGKLIHKYCQQHLEFCCDSCLGLKHRFCSNVVEISEVAAGVIKTREPIEVTTTMKKLIGVYKDIIKKREQDKKPVISQRSDCLKAIKLAREKVNKKFDALEERLEKRLELISNKELGRIDSHVDTCQKNLQALADALDRINVSMKTKSETEVFVTLRKMSLQLPDFQAHLRQTQKEDQVVKFKFRVDEKVQKLLETATELGEIQVNTFLSGGASTANRPSLGAVPEPGRTLAGHALPPITNNSEGVKQVTKRRRRTTLQHVMPVGEYNIRLAREQDCCITSATFLQSGDVVLVDKANNALKLFNSGFRCVSQLQLAAGLWDVCVSGVKKYDILVSLSVKCYIQQVSVGSRKLKHGTSFQTEGECWGLTWCNLGLAVIVNTTTGHQLQIMDSMGNLRKRIQFGRDGARIFSQPLYVKAMRDGHRLLVSDYQSDSVICVDSVKGVALFTYQDTDLNGPHGITVDEKDYIYVTGHKSDNVLQLTANGEKIKVLLSEKDEVTVPFGLAFHAKSRSLLITAWSDTVKLIRLS